MPCSHAVMLLTSSPGWSTAWPCPFHHGTVAGCLPLSPVQHGELDHLGEVLGRVLAEEGAQVAVAHQVRADLLKPGRLLAGGAHGGARTRARVEEIKPSQIRVNDLSHAKSEIRRHAVVREGRDVRAESICGLPRPVILFESPYRPRNTARRSPRHRLGLSSPHLGDMGNVPSVVPAVGSVAPGSAASLTGTAAGAPHGLQFAPNDGFFLMEAAKVSSRFCPSGPGHHAWVLDPMAAHMAMHGCPWHGMAWPYDWPHGMWHVCITRDRPVGLAPDSISGPVGFAPHAWAHLIASYVLQPSPLPSPGRQPRSARAVPQEEPRTCICPLARRWGHALALCCPGVCLCAWGMRGPNVRTMTG